MTWSLASTWTARWARGRGCKQAVTAESPGAATTEGARGRGPALEQEWRAAWGGVELSLTGELVSSRRMHGEVDTGLEGCAAGWGQETAAGAGEPEGCPCGRGQQWGLGKRRSDLGFISVFIKVTLSKAEKSQHLEGPLEKSSDPQPSPPPPPLRGSAEF